MKNIARAHTARYYQRATEHQSAGRKLAAIGVERDQFFGKVRKKVIEVKGYWTDEDTDNDKDYPTKSISISSAEWEMVKKDPKNFVLWVVYRLDRNHKENTEVHQDCFVNLCASWRPS